MGTGSQRADPPVDGMPVLSGVVVRWDERVLVIGEAEPGLPVAQFAREPGRQPVLVGAALAAAALIALLRTHLPPGCASIRLAMSGAARPTDPIAQTIANALDLEVVAPDGTVELLPSGVLFVHDGDGSGAWWTFRPGVEPVRGGARHPAPPWQTYLPHRHPHLPGVTARFIPAGVWLSSADDRPPPADDPAYRLAPDGATLSVLVGRPGGAALDPEHLARYVLALAPDARRYLTLVPYGPGGAAVDAVVDWLLAEIDTVVDIVAGPAAPTSAGGTTRAVLDDLGRPAWRPFAERVAYAVGKQPRVTEAHPPVPGLPALEPAAWRINQDWAVEAVRCGLWLREIAVGSTEPAARSLPADPTRLLLVVGSAQAPTPADPVWSLVTKLVTWLPADARDRVQLAVPASPPNQPQHLPPAALADPYGPVLLVNPSPPTSAALPPVPDAAPGESVPAGLARSEPALLGSTTTGTALSVIADGGAVLGPAQIAADHRSTDAERQALRDWLGSQYDAEARVVANVLTERPGLRNSAAAEHPDTLVTDLVAVSVAAALGPAALGAGPEPLQACLVSGLRRLPTHVGLLLADWGAEAGPLDGGPGTTFTTTVPLAASVPMPDFEITAVVWSLTARRIDLLTNGDEAVFVAGTTFRVLDVVTTAVGVRVAYLRELALGASPDPADPESAAVDARILARLSAAAVEVPGLT
ncbi:hypothetical protein [Actinoplanes sp. NPDC051859]|uniref:hypothetical protein n=1 Tax=Actinoplanes sp. NPDC051859 TaxID=3363909 RepID=UPI0037AA547C